VRLRAWPPRPAMGRSGRSPARTDTHVATYGEPPPLPNRAGGSGGSGAGGGRGGGRGGAGAARGGFYLCDFMVHRKAPGWPEANQRHRVSRCEARPTPTTLPRPPTPPPAPTIPLARHGDGWRPAVPGGLKLNRSSSRQRAIPSPTWAMLVGNRQLAQISDSTRCSAHRVPTSPMCPTMRGGGVIPGGKDRPDLFQHREDSRRPCRSMAMSPALKLGRCDHDPPPRRHDRAGRRRGQRGEVVARFLSSSPAPSPMRCAPAARIPLLIGRSLTDKVRTSWAGRPSELFIRPSGAG